MELTDEERARRARALRFALAIVAAIAVWLIFFPPQIKSGEKKAPVAASAPVARASR